MSNGRLIYLSVIPRAWFVKYLVDYNGMFKVMFLKALRSSDEECHNLLAEPHKRNLCAPSSG